MSTAVTTALKDAVKVAGIVLVVLGAVPAIAQAAGVAHIVVPAQILGYATVATVILTAFVSWARSKGLASKAAAKLGL